MIKTIELHQNSHAEVKDPFSYQILIPLIVSWLRRCTFTPSFTHSASLLPFVLCVSEQPFVFCSTLLPQIEVVNTFKSGTSFQGAGALRRQSSTTSQTQDVTNVSSPSHVSLSNALSSPTSTTAATAPSTTGRESDLCQSASLLFLLQGCHRVVNQNPQAYNHLHFVVGISEVPPPRPSHFSAALP